MAYGLFAAAGYPAPRCNLASVMVNGTPRLTCAVFLNEFYPEPIRIEPLAYFPIERDLVTVMDSFMEKLQSVKPWLIRNEGEEKPEEEGEYLQSPAELASYKQFSMCINCMLCYAACPVTGLESEFIGPAAIALGM